MHSSYHIFLVPWRGEVGPGVRETSQSRRLQVISHLHTCRVCCAKQAAMCFTNILSSFSQKPWGRHSIYCSILQMIKLKCREANSVAQIYLPKTGCTGIRRKVIHCLESTLPLGSARGRAPGPSTDHFNFLIKWGKLLPLLPESRHKFIRNPGQKEWPKSCDTAVSGNTDRRLRPQTRQCCDPAPTIVEGTRLPLAT